MSEMLKQMGKSTDEKLTVAEAYAARPRKWILYTVIVLIIATLIGWSSSNLGFKGITTVGTEVAKGVFYGIFNPDKSMLFGTKDTDVPYLLLQTIAIAVLGTIFGSVLAIPFAFLASENIMPKPVAYIFRVLIMLIRTIPSLVWALMWSFLWCCYTISLLNWHDIENVYHGHRRSGYENSRKSGRYGVHTVSEDPLRSNSSAYCKFHFDCYLSF